MERESQELGNTPSRLDISPEHTIITTHVNAHFDALGSLLATQKLYPKAQVVFPGAQEKNLRNFFISSVVYVFNMTDIQAIDLTQVRRLGLVDTRNIGRIGKLAALVGRPDVEIHIYDHHPSSENDIRGSFEACEPTGANVTILVEAIRAQGVEVSPDEATIMCLGLYEDTGSFTFSSTTEKDFLAAAFLLSKGANLNMVSDLIARELSPDQVSLLNDMIQAASRSYINGVEVALTSIALETYVPDFAFLVQKMAKMENLDVFFALALMESKIYIVARSRIEDVDVAAILAALGGGGHPYAAAATVKGQTLAQTEHHLVEILYEKIKARRLARHLMSSPAISVEPEVSFERANQLLTRYNINALLVVEKSDEGTELHGYITRQVIEKALFHKLAAVPVSAYMNTSGYNFGCALLKMTSKGVTEVWRNNSMRNHVNSCVLVNGYLYGYDEGELKCLDWKTSDMKWGTKEYGKGSLMVADGKLILFGQNGKLGTAEVSPEAYKPLSNFQALGGKNTWASPVLANGRIYVRNLDKLAAFDVSEK